MKTIINIQADEQVNRLMSWILEGQGYAIINIRDPSAMRDDGQVADGSRPDLIIINTNLSVAEKRACIEALRAIVPSVRIIDLAAGAEHPNYDSGADFYLTKPFHADDLLERVTRAMGDIGTAAP